MFQTGKANHTVIRDLDIFKAAAKLHGHGPQTARHWRMPHEWLSAGFAQPVPSPAARLAKQSTPAVASPPAPARRVPASRDAMQQSVPDMRGTILHFPRRVGPANQMDGHGAGSDRAKFARRRDSKSSMDAAPVRVTLCHCPECKQIICAMAAQCQYCGADTRPPSLLRIAMALMFATSLFAAALAGVQLTSEAALPGNDALKHKWTQNLSQEQKDQRQLSVAMNFQ